jgi:hypothetical protein
MFWALARSYPFRDFVSTRGLWLPKRVFRVSASCLYATGQLYYTGTHSWKVRFSLKRSFVASTISRGMRESDAGTAIHTSFGLTERQISLR